MLKFFLPLNMQASPKSMHIIALHPQFSKNVSKYQLKKLGNWGIKVEQPQKNPQHSFTRHTQISNEAQAKVFFVLRYEVYFSINMYRKVTYCTKWFFNIDFFPHFYKKTIELVKAICVSRIHHNARIERKTMYTCSFSCLNISALVVVATPSSPSLTLN